LQIARRIQFHQVTLSGNAKASGVSDIDPVQREIFDMLKLELPSKERLENTTDDGRAYPFGLLKASQAGKRHTLRRRTSLAAPTPQVKVVRFA
jgi:hypothetical protein